MKIGLLFLASYLLAGCESTRRFAHEHPVVTGVGIAILAGSIVASVHNGESKKAATNTAIGPAPSCTPQPNGTCR